MNISIQPQVFLDAKKIDALHETYEHFCWEASEAQKIGNKAVEAHYRFHARRLAMLLPRRLDQ